MTPGDRVRETVMRKNTGPGRFELGSVVIQWFRSDMYRVATFLPGVHVWLEGDTPKTEPEQALYVRTEEEADSAYNTMVGQARKDGWRYVYCNRKTT